MSDLIEIAGLSGRVTVDKFRPTVVIPRPVRFTWAGLDVPLDTAEVSVDNDGLTLRIKAGVGDFHKFHERVGRLNEPGSILLEDGSSITTPHAHLARTGTSLNVDGPSFSTFDVEFDYWEWLPERSDTRAARPTTFTGMRRTSLPANGADDVSGEALESRRRQRHHLNVPGRIPRFPQNRSMDWFDCSNAATIAVHCSLLRRVRMGSHGRLGSRKTEYCSRLAIPNGYGRTD